MALQDILVRYDGYGILVYGGDQEFVDMLVERGTVVSWVNNMDGTIPIPQVVPDKLIQVIVTTTGYVDGSRVEPSTLPYLELASAVIYHGYPEFKVEGMEVTKEVYTGGCLITRMNGKEYRTDKLASLIPSNGDNLLPYVHLYTRLATIKEDEGTLRIPIAEGLPTSIDTGKRMSVIHSSSVYVDKERKLLVSAIDLALRAPPKSVLLYYGDLYIKWLTTFLDLFLLSKDIEIHLWGRDQGVVLPSSPSVLIRPEGLGKGDEPSVDDYISRYGSTPNIIVLADEINDDLIRLNPIAAYLPYKGGLPGTPVVTPWTTLGRASLLYIRGDKRVVQVTQENIDAFHRDDRTNSYNMGMVIDEVLGTRSGVGRSIPVPDLGLCTCYDCCSEVSIVTKYMVEMEVPFSVDNLVGLLSHNGSSLWSMSKPIVRPHQRKNLLLLPSDVDKILDLDITMYENIGIGVDEKLLSSNSLYIEGDMKPMERMMKVIQGERYPLVVSFHRDFFRNYNPDTDKGRSGDKKYRKFLQDVSLNNSGLDTWGVLLLYILAR